LITLPIERKQAIVDGAKNFKKATTFFAKELKRLKDVLSNRFE
jgi:hypothetical protein